MIINHTDIFYTIIIPAYLFAVPDNNKNDIDLPFGKQLVDDVLNRTETAMTQAHCFLASELTLKTQKNAVKNSR